jgi:hypothetical protein
MDVKRSEDGVREWMCLEVGGRSAGMDVLSGRRAECGNG